MSEFAPICISFVISLLVSLILLGLVLYMSINPIAIVFSTLLAIMIELKLFRWCFQLYNYLVFDLELEIHQDFLFLLVLILVFVLWILVRTLWHLN